jgi:hypothetical protein
MGIAAWQKVGCSLYYRESRGGFVGEALGQGDPYSPPLLGAPIPATSVAAPRQGQYFIIEREEI